MRELTARIRQLLVPNGLVLAAAAVLLPRTMRSLLAPPAGQFIVVAMLLAVILLAWRFRSPRILLMAVLLLMAHSALMWARPGASGHALRNLVAILLPLNITALLLVDEPSFDLEAGGWWAGMISAQAVMAATLSRPEQARSLDWMKRPLFSSLAAPASLPQIAVLLFLACGLALLSAFLLSRRPRDSGLFWGACACFLALASPDRVLAVGYFATGALILGIAVVETSYLIAYHDELTGLPARRLFNQTVARLDGDYTIAMVDVDRFKQFNDTFGHDVGDQVLRMVAAKLAAVGGSGKAFRYGGEEFAIVFSHMAAKAAWEHSEALRRTIEASIFAVRGPDRSHRRRKDRRYHASKRRLRRQRVDTRVTVSIGLADRGGARTSVDDVLRGADQALYSAKNLGRNRVEIYKGRKQRVLAPTAS